VKKSTKKTLIIVGLTVLACFILLNIIAYVLFPNPDQYEVIKSGCLVVPI
jgi:hypothetical protein